MKKKQITLTEFSQVHDIKLRYQRLLERIGKRRGIDPWSVDETDALYEMTDTLTSLDEAVRHASKGTDVKT